MPNKIGSKLDCHQFKLCNLFSDGCDLSYKTQYFQFLSTEQQIPIKLNMKGNNKAPYD